MKNVFTFVMTGIVCVLCAIGIFVACVSPSDQGTPPDPGAAIIATTSSSLKEDAVPASVITIPAGMLPEAVVTALGATDENPIVITVASNVTEGSKIIPMDGVDLTKPEGILDFFKNPSVSALVSTVIPNGAAYLAIFESLMLLFSKRKRELYGTAVKSTVTMKPAQALNDITKALGLAHSR